jgi:hypothetical protein
MNTEWILKLFYQYYTEKNAKYPNVFPGEIILLFQIHKWQFCVEMMLLQMMLSVIIRLLLLNSSTDLVVNIENTMQAIQYVF